VARKYTRKALKQPDEFLSLSMRIWSWIQARIPKVLFSLGVAAVVIAGAWVWNHFSERSGRDLTEKLTRGIEIYNQTVVQTSAKLEPSEDGIPRFKTRAEKLKAAEAEFSKLADKGGSLGVAALAMRAAARYDAGRYQEAAADYAKVVAKGPGNKALRERAIENLAYCYEALKDWDKALLHFRKLPRDGEKKYLSMYHEARMLARKGQVKEAGQMFQEIIEKAPPGSIQERASEQLALLDAK
jgi:tetratricopeptide (TPR) repeat protein